MIDFPSLTADELAVWVRNMPSDPDVIAVNDSVEDPLYASGLRFQAALDAAIADAGGLEAWRLQELAKRP